MVAITDMVSLEQRGDIALVLIDNPPVNALSHGVRLGLLKAFEQVAGDDAVKGVVLACRGRTFIAGADITEFGKPPKAPGLAEPQAAIEDCPKPVVAAIHGTALGGGLEVAMCAHYRVGAPAAQYGQPEVKLGLVPGAGGTQRLPRVTGVAKALEMCAIGDPIGSQEALAAGLIDAIIEGDLVDGAVAFAEQLVADGAPLNKIRDRDEKIDEARANRAVFDDFRKQIARKTRNFHAPAKNVDLIEAALDVPFDEALERERDVFERLMAGRQSQAQRYYFFSERQAAKVPDLPRDTALREVKSVGILGAGTMGGGIAMNFLNAGIPVKIVERDQAALDRGLAVVRAELPALRQARPLHDGAGRGAHEPARARHRQVRLRRRRHGHRGRVRTDAAQEVRLHRARRHLPRRRDPRHQHFRPRRERDRRRHQAPAGRDRHALLQPRQRDEAA